jgi:hypothetical protein
MGGKITQAIKRRVVTKTEQLIEKMHDIRSDLMCTPPIYICKINRLIRELNQIRDQIEISKRLDKLEKREKK